MRGKVLFEPCRNDQAVHAVLTARNVLIFKNSSWMRVSSAARSSSSTTKDNRSPEWLSVIKGDGMTGSADYSVSAATASSVAHCGSQTVKQAP